MTTITTTDIPVVATQVQVIDRVAESNGTVNPSSFSKDELLVQVYHHSFGTLIGPSPTHSLLLSTINQTNNPFFHEACVYLPALNELYITSNLLSANTSSAYPTILISRIKLTRSSPDTSSNDIASLQWAKLRPPPGIDMPNGGVNYKDGILFCAQGSPSPRTGGLYYMPLHSPPQPIVTNFYGRDFNSVNDVVVSAVDGGIWFTDPVYGYNQGFRRRPELPGQVYRYDVGSGEVRVVAEGFDRCNGICFGVGETRLYVTDTGLIHGDGTKDFTRPATIYVFDIETKDGAPFLVNRRTFAFAASGVPDGIKCDVYGNVYSGCGDGVEVWNPAGSLIGRIIVPGGVANFCFGKEGELFLCNEQKLWRVQLAETTKGALLGI